MGLPVCNVEDAYVLIAVMVLIESLYLSSSSPVATDTEILIEMYNEYFCDNFPMLSLISLHGLRIHTY